MSIQDLRQNPQDTSNFYLANMYQATINPNVSESLPASPPPFIQRTYAVWVNGLWFLSLVISITCALLATLLQQWARRYIKVTQPRYSPHKRARIRAFFAEGIDKFLLPWAVEALPAMLHVSLFLFFAGLAVFLRNVNLTIFKLVLSWIGLCMALYGCITFTPIFRLDSPYHTPLSLPAWHLVTGIRFLTFRALEWITFTFIYFRYATYVRFRDLAEDHGKLLVRGMQKAAEESAFNSPPEIDTRAFMWTFDCLDEDHELEYFFSGLPGFRGSRMVEDPLPDLTWEQQEKLLDALIGLLDRTSSSDLLTKQVKIRRTVICRKAIDLADIPNAIWQSRVLSRIVSEDQYGPVQSAEVACLVRSWDNGEDEEINTINRAIVSSVVARAQRRDDLWFTMASNEMSVPESVLRDHATHGNNLSLAILNHIIRQQISVIKQQHWIWEEFSKVLSATSKFDVLNTSPELQHEFCALWNEVVSIAYVDVPWYILRRIRNVYLVLHLHTDSAPTEFSASTNDDDALLNGVSAYPLCNIPGHHPDSTPRIHDVSTSTAILHSALHNNAPSVLSFPSDVLPPSVTTPVYVDENPMDFQLLENIPARATSYCAHQTATESVRESATSLDRAAAGTSRDDPSSRTMAPTTRETSTTTPSVSPPDAVSFQNNAAHSGAPESSASPEPVLWDTAGPLSSLKLSSLPFTAYPLNTSSVDHAVQTNIAALPDYLLPIVPFATKITAASSSQQGLDTEHAGDPSDSSGSRFARPV